MVGKADELSRLNGRIAEFERCVAEMRVHPGSGSPLFSSGERIQMLQMLVTTLETMKARRALLERAGQAGCRPDLSRPQPSFRDESAAASVCRRSSHRNGRQVP
jgi:hypothetical protein